MKKFTLLAAMFVALLTTSSASAQDELVGFAENQDGLVQGFSTVDAATQPFLVVSDEFGVIERTPMFVESSGHFIAYSSLNSGNLSLSVEDGISGETQGFIAMPSRPPYTALQIKLILMGLTPGDSNGVFTVPTQEELEELFEDLTEGGTDNTPPTYGGGNGIGASLPDGTWVGFRPKSKSGGATIDIHYPDGTGQKVHIK